MRLSAGEVIGGVAAFIPGVSAVAGIVQTVHYYNKVKDIQVKQVALNNNLGIQGAIKDQLKPLYAREKALSEKLVVTSLLQILPVVNVVSAIFHAVYLSRLSKVRTEIDTILNAKPQPVHKPATPKPAVVKPAVPKPVISAGPIEASAENLLEVIKEGRCVVKVLSDFGHIRKCLIHPSSPENRERRRHQSAMDKSAGRAAGISKKHLLNKEKITTDQASKGGKPNFIVENKKPNGNKKYTHTKSTSTTLISKLGQGRIFHDKDGDYDVGLAFDHEGCKPAKFAYFKLDGHTRSQWWRQGPNEEARVEANYLESEIKSRMAENFSDLHDCVNKEGKYAPGGGGFVPTTTAFGESQNEAYLKLALKNLSGIIIRGQTAFESETAKMRAISQKVRLEIDSKQSVSFIVNLPIAVLNRGDGPLIYKVADQKVEIEAYLQGITDDPSQDMFISDRNLPGLEVTPNELSAYYGIDLSKFKR